MQIINETDMVYGVSHSARISSIVSIRREDALVFLQAEEARAAQDQLEADD